ncbi:MAG: SDR family oxidoreductase [Methanobacteriota archaeon]|nr:MAG: SDR family oxidoreductase [Euryarchaeota archaeon]
MAAIGTTPIEDRVWIVTGANSGIGKATALGLARLGGTVVMACRDAERGGAAQREVVQESKNSKVTLMIVDLASQASIQSFVEEFSQDYRRLDALVNNAGVFTWKRELTPDGLERQFAVNYLAGFLLSHLLLDKLTASSPSRIVNVTSTAGTRATIDFDDLQGEKKYRGYTAYGQSKLAQFLFTAEFARRLEGTGVTVNACHPGVIKTNLGGQDSPAIFRFVRIFFKKPAKGAETPVYLAASPAASSLTGQYFRDRAVHAMPPKAQDRDVARRLYEASLGLAGLKE